MHTCLLLAYDAAWIKKNTAPVDDHVHASPSLTTRVTPVVEMLLLKGLIHDVEFGLRRKITRYFIELRSGGFSPWERLDERFDQVGTYFSSMNEFADNFGTDMQRQTRRNDQAGEASSVEILS